MEHQKGEDIEIAVEVALWEVCLGSTRSFSVQSPYICSKCSGTGKRRFGACRKCEGLGWLHRSKVIEVKIPAGVDDGSRIRVAGEGQMSTDKGPGGDLYLLISVLPDPLFERRGDDLWTTVSIERGMVRKGGHVPLQHPDGRNLDLIIPARVTDGKRLRLREQGIPRLQKKGRGDLFALICVD